MFKNPVFINEDVKIRVVKWIAKIAIIAKLRLRKNTISQITQFSFLTIGRNRNITQFDFLEGRNCESCENYYIEGFFFEKWVNRSWILDLQNFSNSNFIFG